MSENTKWRFVEPFVGAGAVFWHLGNPDSVINDFDADVMNFYTQVAAQHPDFLAGVATVEKIFASGNRDRCQQAYYDARNLDRDPGLTSLTGPQRAARFFVVNQLAFSGMRRFNAQGKFNVPFGHYRSFNAAGVRSADHVRLLTSAGLSTGDYAPVLDANDHPNTFMFVDPPYTRVMKTYSANNHFGDAEQQQLADRLKAIRHASWMVVIDRCEMTERLYDGYIRHTYPLSYGVNIRNRFSSAAEHLVATNYNPPNPR